MARHTEETVLRMNRRFRGSRERVFDAWTNPEVLRRWWAAGPTWDTPVAEVDLRPGGRYRLAMRDAESGAVHAVGGEYVAVSRPERLTYTWTWEGAAEVMEGSQQTLVTVEFLDEGDATEVVVTHEGFADERIRDLHEEGWVGCLANLERRVLEPTGH
jgi:uncharacterized protein YndB with AHSA1/START domain